MDSDGWDFRAEDWCLLSLRYHCGKAGVTCYVAGEFCGWMEDEWMLMTEKEDGVYCVSIRLLEGCYQYKFVVDGKWESDPCNPFKEVRFGNSLLFVGDFDRRAREGLVSRLVKDCPVPCREYSRHGERGSGQEFQIIPEQDLVIPEKLAGKGILARPLFVYLPPDYYESKEKIYPVLYALDGQNVFSTSGWNSPPHGGWWLDSQLDLLVADHATQPFILVAVPNGDAVSEYPLRKREYCPKRYAAVREEPFACFLIDVVKRTIDNRFRTQPEPENTVILGASLGGMYAFALLLCAPGVFGKAISMSPSFWYYDSENVSIYDIVRQKFLVEQDFEHTRKVYLHVADGDGDNMYETKEMAHLLEEVGEGFVAGRDFYFDLDSGRRNECEGGDTHSESVWRHRLHIGLRFLLPPMNENDELSHGQ